ncbi:MAG TPA: hypothetical protein VK665_06495 [Candidatus Elarobacter sp.]|nr:hypothetical protein [Candidatus Elarobacter sp.]
MTTLLGTRDDTGRIVGIVLSELREEFGARLLGVVLTGSGATDSACASSDVDLFAIATTDWFQRRRITREGVAVDLFIEPTTRLDLQLRRGGNVAYIHALAHGIILADSGSVARRYVDLARSVHAAGPPAPTGGDLFMVRLRARTLLDKTRSVVHDDPHVARYLLTDLAAWAPQAAFSVLGGWPPSPKGMLREIRLRWPALYERAIALLDPTLSLSERLSAAEAYYRALLGDDLTTADEFIGPRASIGLHRRIVIGDGDVVITDARPR